jgi:hypothetical protein
VKNNGGAIASIGATRVSYRNLGAFFFSKYEEGISISQMFTQAQIDCINSIGKDYFTLEEFILLGDPSLKIGGY